jgi:hypothetical protein
MRPIVMGLAAVLAVSAIAPAALSQKKPAEEITAEARQQGMAEAPAVAQAAGISCQVADARLIGKQEDKKAKTSTSFYEIDCAQGLGFVLQAAAGAPKPSVYSCIEANAPGPDGKPSSLACKLPGNADPKADLAPLIAKAGVQCAPTQVRSVGQSASSTYIEVACQGGAGYVLQTSLPADAAKPVTASNCLQLDNSGGNIKCELGDKTQRLAMLDQYVTAAKNNCAVKERRYIGASTTGAEYFETSCQDGKGYVYKIEKQQLSQTIPCERAQGILGGCTLTDARAAATEQAALYTRLAKGVGFNCDVAKYAAFPAPMGQDVVELQCSNRPDGGVGIFNASGKGKVVDCAKAPIAGYRCSYTKPEAGYSGLTADLKKMGKGSCVVSKDRVIGKSAKGTAFVEVACADGLKGYILEYSADTFAPVGVVGCAFTKDCKLPGNA